MNVYFAAAITRYRKLLPVYRSIVSIIEDLGHEVLSKHVVDPKLTEGDWESAYEPKKLWERELRRLKKCECMVAEVTTPSFGTAFLMEEALKQKKPLLSLYYTDVGMDKVPLMLRGNKRINLKIYTEETARKILKAFFSQI